MTAQCRYVEEHIRPSGFDVSHSHHDHFPVNYQPGECCQYKLQLQEFTQEFALGVIEQHACLVGTHRIRLRLVMQALCRASSVTQCTFHLLPRPSNLGTSECLFYAHLPATSMLLVLNVQVLHAHMAAIPRLFTVESHHEDQVTCVKNSKLRRLSASYVWMATRQAHILIHKTSIPAQIFLWQRILLRGVPGTQCH